MSTIPAKVTKSSRRTHQVQPGDTLYSIATQYNTNWPAVFNANKRVLNNSTVPTPGQTLTIPF